MVDAIVEVAVEGEVPAPRLRLPVSGEIRGGVRFGRVEMGIHAAAGAAYPDDVDWYEGLGVGWEGIAGVRTGVLVPLATVALRPMAEVAAQYRVQPQWSGEVLLQRYGVLLRGGVDLVLAPSESTWIAGGVAGGWSSLDDAARIQVGIRVGTTIGRRTAP